MQQNENVTLLPHEIQLIQKCIAWAAQQGYYKAEEVGVAFGRLVDAEMYEDQPYYNSYNWRAKKVI